MSWQEKHTMTLRQEFVELARQDGANIRELCRRYEISPKTGYKWLNRFEQAKQEVAALADRSRRPHTHPARTAPQTEQWVIELRQRHPSWGARKIAARLLTLRGQALASSTVNSILQRHGLISQQASEAAQPWQRFEHDTPNSLWQIDFKGHFQTLAGVCHPLTLLDDHSRFSLNLSALARADGPSVQARLQTVFQNYGMPLRINADNGSPWGSPSQAEHGISRLSVWLIRLGIRVSHSRAYHPQTNGKIERFHRSLQAEVINTRSFCDLSNVQRAMDHWRDVYNCQRPHEALQMQTPIQRYRSSPVAYPQRLPAIEYSDGDHVLMVGSNGFVTFQGRRLRLSSALYRLPVAVRPDRDQDGCFDFYFCHQRFMRLDMREPDTDT